jgi:molybdopterin/thiamine biosynthesis adenylyltransferase/rhodanese-related sulfurtransferase
MKTVKDMLSEAREVIPEQGPNDLKRRLDAGEPLVLVDVRDPDEYRDGFIEPATNISRGFLEFRVAGAAADPATPIVLYCQSGLRSMLAAKVLKDLGYENVTNLQGGFQKWAQSGLPVVKDRPMNADQIQRYSRHFLLNQVGEKGQRKLLRSKVLLIGAGGLGSPTALYLAAAGVGTIGIIDMDVVDESNLQRQILHNLDRIGDRKVDSAKKTLTLLNPDVNVVTFDVRLGADNVMEILEGFDIVVDGTDNFPTRFLVNDASVKLGIPVVHGSIFRFEGMVTVFDPRRGPTYRDMVPEPPPAEMAPSCAEAGVLGVLPGIVGSLQAIETIKLILDLGDPLIGRLLAYDSLEQSFREYKVQVDPANEITYENRDRIVVAELDEQCMPHPLQAPPTQ